MRYSLIFILILAACGGKGPDRDATVSEALGSGPQPDCSTAQCTFIHTASEFGCFVSKTDATGAPKGAPECDYLFDSLCPPYGLGSDGSHFDELCENNHIVR